MFTLVTIWFGSSELIGIGHRGKNTCRVGETRKTNVNVNIVSVIAFLEFRSCFLFLFTISRYVEGVTLYARVERDKNVDLEIN